MIRDIGRQNVNRIVMNESEVQDFWNRYPCGDSQVGGLQQRRGDYEAFFTDYDNYRYRKEAHILRCLDSINFKGKQVLEIGLGQGADSEQIIKRGAIWSGLDLTSESVDRVQTRLSLRQLPHQSLKQASLRFLMKTRCSISYLVMVSCTTCPMFWQLNAKFTVF